MALSEISPREASELLASVGARLIDVREENEWLYCHVHGAELIPLSRFGEEATLRLHEEECLLMLCHHGVRSAHAGGLLVQRGYTNVKNITGGIDAWSCEVDPGLPRY